MGDGIIKMKTRLTYSELLPEPMKHPIIFGKGSRLSELVIMDTHATQLHAGPEKTKRLVRNKFWVIGGKRAISKVINNCNHKECASRRMKPVLQPPPPLPKERLGNDCFRNISIIASWPYDMKNAVCVILAPYVRNVMRRKTKKKEKPMNKRKIVQPRKFESFRPRMNMRFSNVVNERYDTDLERQPKEPIAVATKVTIKTKKIVSKHKWLGSVIPSGIDPSDLDKPVQIIVNLMKLKHLVTHCILAVYGN